ncbi:MAG: hypothetical protein K0M45_11410 [Candidatus Paracaedibacteraceae bacterium]|nr:hypothetical protein [Candidatus Paracaedibacteraceae bacterium]
MNYFFKTISILFSSIFLFSSQAMEQNQDISEEVKGHLRNIYKKINTIEESQQVALSSIKVLKALQSWPKTQESPSILVKGAGTAFGQLCFYSPFSLQFFEDTLIPYLENKELSYANLRPFYYQFRFGEKHNRASTNPDIAERMSNGQLLSCHFDLNYPVYFNKLLSEFKGEFLLIGGGKNCECGDATNRHPEESFYSVDIDNNHLPNMVIHAGYLEHLYTFPNERFSFIWLEHCSVGELILDKKVLEQYFRFSKPGCIFLFQSSFFLKNQAAVYEEAYKAFAEALKEYRFAVLESTQSSVRRRPAGYEKTEMFEFKQFIAMKPLKIGAEEGFSKPDSPIDITLYREPSRIEQYYGLLWAKILSGQLKLTLAFDVDKINSWIEPQTEDKKQ